MMLAPVGRTGPLSCPADWDGFTRVPSDGGEESLKARGDGPADDVGKATQREELPIGWTPSLRRLVEAVGGRAPGRASHEKRREPALKGEGRAPQIGSGTGSAHQRDRVDDPPALLSEPRLPFPHGSAGLALQEEGFSRSRDGPPPRAAVPLFAVPSVLQFTDLRADLLAAPTRPAAKDLPAPALLLRLPPDRARPRRLRQVERLGRHCLLFHERLRPKQALSESLVVDGLETFEFSQYTPVHLHTAVGGDSHYFYGFTDSELRRKGRMTAKQQRRRAQLELDFGRPDPRSIEREMAALVALVAPAGSAVAIHSDDHPAYPRALARLRDRDITHATTRSTVARTPRNPLFPVNLLDLLIRHSSANHKRETIAFSKRRQSAAERLFVLVVWRNYMKSFSERKRDATPAQRLGILGRKLTVDEVLAVRLFPKRIGLPDRWALYYWRLTPTRRIPNGRRHTLRYAV